LHRIRAAPGGIRLSRARGESVHGLLREQHMKNTCETLSGAPEKDVIYNAILF